MKLSAEQTTVIIDALRLYQASEQVDADTVDELCETLNCEDTRNADVALLREVAGHRAFKNHPTIGDSLRRIADGLADPT